MRMKRKLSNHQKQLRFFTWFFTILMLLLLVLLIWLVNRLHF